MVGRRLGVVVMGLLCLTVGVAGCAVGGGSSESNESVPAGQVVWDFRSPLTPMDLGGDFTIFHQLDGEIDIRVVFPSGRVVERVVGRGVRAESLAALGQVDGSAMPVDRVLFLELSVMDIDGLRASAERFVEEWGPASDSDGTIEAFLERTERLYEQAGTEFRQTYPVGENVFPFDAEEQDGVMATWIARFVVDRVTIRVGVAFDPASAGQAFAGQAIS